MSTPQPAKKQRREPSVVEKRGWTERWADFQDRLTYAKGNVRKYTVHKLDDGSGTSNFFGITIRDGPADPVPICDMKPEMIQEFLDDFHGPRDKLTDVENLKSEDLQPLLKAMSQRLLCEDDPPETASWRKMRGEATIEREGGVDPLIFNPYAHLLEAEDQLVRMCGRDYNVYTDEEVMEHQADMAVAYNVLCQQLCMRCAALNLATSKRERMDLGKVKPMPTLLGTARGLR